MTGDPGRLTMARAESPDALAAVRCLLEEYGREFGGPDLLGDGFEAELSNLPGPYSPPLGRLLLAEYDEVPVGCAGRTRRTGRADSSA